MLMEIKGLSKSFKNKKVLQNLDMQIAKADLILIQGTNGCGKSTLLKIIAGLMKCDDGEIITSEPIKLGAFIENPSFIENETALFNMQFLMELNGKFDKEKVAALCDKFYLDLDDQTPVKKFSIGMRQKLGIIQAIMEDQNFILFDEPTRGLDKESMEIFDQLIMTLQKEEKTIIICAHDGVSNIPFNKAYKMEEGRLVEQ